MLFSYKARTPEGEITSGTIDAASSDMAISSLQRRNLIVVSLKESEKAKPLLQRGIKIFEYVKARDVVILSRQLSTLFEAKVPVVDALKVLTSEATTPVLRRHLSEILDDIQGGVSISQAFSKHPKVFSKFYVSMVRSGEESGKLDEIFLFLADHLERSYDLAMKARNALTYPAFVLAAFVGVMILMLVMVVPRLSTILAETGQEIPVYTKIIVGISELVRQYGVFLLVLFAIGVVMLWRYIKTEAGSMALSRAQISVPIIGELYRKLYLARMADNLQTLLAGGVPIVRALEITADVVGNGVYRSILQDATSSVKSGDSISQSLSRYDEIPALMSQMIRIGEETGKLDFILETIAKFYRREVDNAVDNMVNLIEPVMIIALGLGVGVLVVSILVPIYNISTSF